MGKKLLWKVLPMAFLAGVGSTAFTSCADEYDPANITREDILKENYAKNWEEVFGTPDPNQDWSMAQPVVANVSGVENGMLELYYSDPIGGKMIILAKHLITDGTATFKFDVVKGTRKIFARINDGKGYYSLKSNFLIKDGEVNISPASTRAVPTGTSRVTKSEPYSLTSPLVLDKTRSSEYEILPRTGDFGSDWYIDGCYAHTEGGNVSFLVKNSSYYTTGEFTNIYKLNDVISEDDERPEWYIKDIAHFFTSIDGGTPVFDEGTNHVKLMRKDSKPHLEKDLVFTMEEDGPFYLDYFAKGTNFNNQLGYFYFTGENPTPEEFMTMPKFILVDNMSTSSGEVTINTEKQIGWNLLQTKIPTGSLGSYDGFSYSNEAYWDTKIVGTRLQLTYFGENGTDTQGSYTFPADTKIGLFIIGNSDMNRVNEFITSISSINLDLFNEYPHAASFQYNNQVVFAMEDQRQEGDADLNDVMFIANGTFKKDEIPDIDPVVPEYPTWIVACEDLGGTFDYDFNDLVFGLRKEDNGDGTSNLYLVPLAAGGTLNAEVYYNTTLVGEIHNLVQEGASTSVPLNVSAGSNPGEGAPVLIAQNIDSSTSINDLAQNIKVKIAKNSGETENAGTYNIGFKKGDSFVAPQMLLLQPGWDWPSEGTFILDVYPGFEAWTGDIEETGWYVKKEGATHFVHNPVPEVVTPPTGGDDNPGGGETPSPSVNPLLPEFNITVAGTNTMQKGGTLELTVSIDGVDDLSGLVCGTYSTSVITATKKEGTTATYVITGVANGTALFYAKMPGDENHKTTRKEYEITVTNPVPEFTVTYNNSQINEGDIITHTWNGGYDFVNIGFNLIKGTGYRVQCTSSNIGVAEVSTSGFNIKGTGETTITIKHISGSDGTTTWEEASLTFTLKVTAQGSSEPEQGGEEGTPETEDKIFELSSATDFNMGQYTISAYKIALDESDWEGVTSASVNVTGTATGFYIIYSPSDIAYNGVCGTAFTIKKDVKEFYIAPNGENHISSLTKAVVTFVK